MGGEQNIQLYSLYVNRPCQLPKLTQLTRDQLSRYRFYHGPPFRQSVRVSRVGTRRRVSTEGHGTP